MKKLCVIMCAALLAGSLFTGCVSSQSQTLASNEVPAQARVLGPISVESKTYSYKNILEAAKKRYPETEDVVHIQTDVLSTGRYVMYGIAVCY